jgi:hypothetical protein
MILYSNQRNKWLAAEEDNIQSFATSEVLAKNSKLPAGATLSKKYLKGVIVFICTG